MAATDSAAGERQVAELLQREAAGREHIHVEEMAASARAEVRQQTACLRRPQRQAASPAAVAATPQRGPSPAAGTPDPCTPQQPRGDDKVYDFSNGQPGGVCVFNMKGFCGKGASCRYVHDSSDPGNIVKITGMPYTVTTAQVLHFFSPLETVEDGVTFVTSIEGRPTGSAFVEFRDRSAALVAVGRDRGFFTPSRFVLIFPSSRRERDWFVRHPQPFSATPGAPRSLRGLPSGGSQPLGTPSRAPARPLPMPVPSAATQRLSWRQPVQVVPQQVAEPADDLMQQQQLLLQQQHIISEQQEQLRCQQMLLQSVLSTPQQLAQQERSLSPDATQYLTAVAVGQSPSPGSLHTHPAYSRSPDFRHGVLPPPQLPPPPHSMLSASPPPHSHVMPVAAPHAVQLPRGRSTPRTAAQWPAAGEYQQRRGPDASPARVLLHCFDEAGDSPAPAPASPCPSPAPDDGRHELLEELARTLQAHGVSMPTLVRAPTAQVVLLLQHLGFDARRTQAILHELALIRQKAQVVHRQQPAASPPQQQQQQQQQQHDYDGQRPSSPMPDLLPMD